MAFLKFSRDKRGYEQFSLVQPANRGKARPRLLYWFRTPPNIKVGRSPFDPDMRRALEAQNPDVAFDWAAIVRTPIPPVADNERWRERRRAERAVRAAQAPEDGEATAEPGEPPASAEVEKGSYPFSGEAEVEPVESVAAVEAATTSNVTSPVTSPASESAGGGRRRRRRRRRGRRKPQGVQGSGFQVPGSEVQGSKENPEPGTRNPEPGTPEPGEV